MQKVKQFKKNMVKRTEKNKIKREIFRCQIMKALKKGY